MAPIKHVFVLMLENRSFDHVFGLSGLAGVPRPTDPGFGAGAPDQCEQDPPHEFGDVQSQIAGGAMSGFSADARKGFTSAQIPVLTTLAQEYVLFDNWHASVPGPTWPNRFFVHAATSGGLATSPTQFQASGAVISTTSPYRFANGSIYDRLDRHGVKWRVYHGDIHPQVLALPGMVSRFLKSVENFCPIYPGTPHLSDFASDLISTSGYPAAYTFIEPNYAVQIDSQFRYGDSQHPPGKVSAGEGLVKYIYESLRNSPLWPQSVLLILWDEHGGFYDHVRPPAAVPPGDAPLNRPSDGSDPGFAFDRLGVRVPAVLVSPWAPRGRLGSELFPGGVFDHASVIRSVFECFGVPGSLTARDAAAPTWNAGLMDTARSGATDGPALLPAPAGTVSSPAERPPTTVPHGDVDGFVAGAGLVALDVDRQLATVNGRAPIASTQAQTPEEYAAARNASLQDPAFALHVTQYINEVGVRAQGQRVRLGLGQQAS